MMTPIILDLTTAEFDVAYELSCAVGTQHLAGSHKLTTAMDTVQELAQPLVTFLKERGYAPDLGGAHTLIVVGHKKAVEDAS